DRSKRETCDGPWIIHHRRSGAARRSRKVIRPKTPGRRAYDPCVTGRGRAEKVSRKVTSVKYAVCVPKRPKHISRVTHQRVAAISRNTVVQQQVAHSDGHTLTGR